MKQYLLSVGVGCRTHRIRLSAASFNQCVKLAQVIVARDYPGGHIRGIQQEVPADAK
jgi:hypothetical protein